MEEKEKDELIATYGFEASTNKFIKNHISEIQKEVVEWKTNGMKCIFDEKQSIIDLCELLKKEFNNAR